MIEIRAQKPHRQILNWLALVLLATAIYGAFAFLAYLTTQPYFIGHPPRYSTFGNLVWTLLMLLPWWLRPVAILWSPTFFVMLVLPILWNGLRRRLGNHYLTRLDEIGISGWTSEGQQVLHWPDLIRIEAIRPPRSAKNPHSAIVLFAKPESIQDPIAQTESRGTIAMVVSFYWFVFYVLGLLWLKGRPLRQPPRERQIRLDDDSEQFSMADVMRFIRQKRPDLVAKIPLPTQLT